VITGETLSALLDELIKRGDVRSVYQPIVDLDSECLVGFEALTRGPVGSPLEMPDDLFTTAREFGRDAELDALCLAAAISNAATLPASCVLFVNVEPTTLSSELIDRTAPIAAAGHASVVLEVTERSIVSNPSALLEGVAAARSRGWRIALDDVGVDPGSLALLPIIRPDVIKLDMGLIRGRPDRELGATMAAVMAHAERTGAAILAEGIEDDDHYERALSLGAVLGQGYRFGRPAELPRNPTVVHTDLGAGSAPRAVSLSPYDAVTTGGPQPRIARKNVLLQISHNVEAQALSDPGAPLLLAAFEDLSHFTNATARRYEALAAHCSICAALGTGMPVEPATGVRGARLLDGDPLTGEWSVVALGSHYAGALLGKDLRDTNCPDGDRRFSYVVTHDRALVELAAESLMRRVIPTIR